MKEKIIYSICGIILIASIAAYFLYGETEKTPLQNNLDETTPAEDAQTNSNLSQASFLVFTNNVNRDFSSAMYRNQNDNIFIDTNPNIVNFRNTNTTWGDFFDTLPLTLTNECLITGTGQTFCNGEGGELRFYLNGNKKDDLLTTIIASGDAALISFGNGNEEIETQLEILTNLESQEN